MESHTTDIFISWVYETIRWKTFTIYIYFHHVLFFRSMFTFSIRLMSKGRLRLQIHHFFFFFLFFFINIIRMKKSRMIFKIVTKLTLFQGPHCYILHLWAFLRQTEKKVVQIVLLSCNVACDSRTVHAKHNKNANQQSLLCSCDIRPMRLTKPEKFNSNIEF